MRQVALALTVVVAVALPGCAVINRFSGMSQASELHRIGMPAEATVLRIWDTGMTVNKNPVVGFLLEVRPPDEAPWRAETKQLVSRLEIPRVRPGQVVAVRYDPADHRRVSLALADAMAKASTATPMPLPRAAEVERERQRLLATGVAGTITLLSCVSLGLYDADGRPVWDLVLTVDLPGRASVRGPARTAVPKEHESWFKAGPRSNSPEVGTAVRHL